MIAQIEQAQRIGDPILGIIIPALILGISVYFTWVLYKRFSKWKIIEDLHAENAEISQSLQSIKIN